MAEDITKMWDYKLNLIEVEKAKFMVTNSDIQIKLHFVEGNSVLLAKLWLRKG